ncbi:MAG: helix-hairpin-helix domain-containing protein [Candidatus Omnitrophota bacterium]|nr:helix-hairpin-helix domain-containing protein [Candidatus Omnitrophota bacterium]
MKKLFFYRQVKENKGIALIMAMGALTVITTISLGFSFNMQMEYKASLNYLNGVKARFLAEAGIERALRDLKEDARARFIYAKNNLSLISGDWDTNGSITNKSLGAGTYTVTALDEQAKVNINTAPNIMFQNLGFTPTQAGDIVNYRSTNGDFAVVEELRKIPSIGSAAYDAVKTSITVNSYLDINSSGRSPVNVNTASDAVLTAVLKGLKSSGTPIKDADVTSLKAGIITARPIDSWTEFDQVVDSAISNSAKRANVKNNCNPNRDKSGLTIATTEFCFFSGGYYTIESTGTVANKAAKKIKAIVKIYETKNETLSTDFSGGIFTNITGNDNCLVDSTAFPNSLKIGYYDVFSANTEWTLSGGAAISSGALTTPDGGSAMLNMNPGKYVLNSGDTISIDAAPRNDGQSGFLLLDHIYYSASDGGLPREVKAVITANRLELKSKNITATWDNLRLLTGDGSYVTRAYSITGAEKPEYTVPYAAVTKVSPSDGSSITMSFVATGSDTIQVRADFSNPNRVDTSAILEDIWFTYLEKSKFLFWQEG